ncbi:MAG TPA: YhgE/Pip domain-containing protein, partial [Lachnospiraceae bacterium]|nr:YhgE/Pip domain-containing protein [Lachnospiraceae bacterium]
MKNIWKIIKNDFQHISTNVVAVVLVIGLCALPSLYAWFNIFSNWNPYEEEATSNLKIAVVSKDQPVTVSRLELCIG